MCRINYNTKRRLNHQQYESEVFYRPAWHSQVYLLHLNYQVTWRDDQMGLWTKEVQLNKLIYSNYVHKSKPSRQQCHQFYQNLKHLSPNCKSHTYTKNIHPTSLPQCTWCNQSPNYHNKCWSAGCFSYNMQISIHQVSRTDAKCGNTVSKINYVTVEWSESMEPKIGFPVKH